MEKGIVLGIKVRERYKDEDWADAFKQIREQV